MIIFYNFFVSYLVVFKTRLQCLLCPISCLIVSRNWFMTKFILCAIMLDRRVQHCRNHGGNLGGCTVTKAPPMGYRCQCRYWGFWTCEGYAEKCNSEFDYGCSGCKEEHWCFDYTPLIGDCSGYSCNRLWIESSELDM